jgi:site-specific recombinase XerD
MKGKKEGRELVLHPQAREALGQLVASLPQEPDTYLFRAQGPGNRPLNRRTAWVVLKKAAKACGLEGKIATHSMRKTFAKRCYDLAGGDIRKVQEAMGHRNLNSTAAYIGVAQEEVDDLILKS